MKPAKSPFVVSFTVDSSARFVTAQGAGLIDSARYIDNYIAFFSGLDAPWQYDYLSDLSACPGFVAYVDLMRLADYWDPYRGRFERTRKVAVVTRDHLMVERMPSMNDLLLDTEHRTFPTLKAAKTWLMA